MGLIILSWTLRWKVSRLRARRRNLSLGAIKCLYQWDKVFNVSTQVWKIHDRIRSQALDEKFDHLIVVSNRFINKTGEEVKVD